MNDEIDLNKVNQIDMECDFIDDDEPIILKSNKNNIEDDFENTDRPLSSKTGVIINLNDNEDENEIFVSQNNKFSNDQNKIKTISAQLNDKGGININKNYNMTFEDEDYHGYNEIDMECKYGEDDDLELLPSENKKEYLTFDDDDFDLKELVDEEMLDEKKNKKKVSQGDVETDYWEKMQKKHAASNKKGSMSMGFHFAGNPEAERQMFNQDMTHSGSIPNAVTFTGEASSFSSGSTGASVGGGEGSCSESLNEDLNKLFNDIFNIIGFEIIKNSDKSYTVLDLCDDENKDCICKDKVELFNYLKPYIDDCFIYPLQIQTGEKFNDYNEWVNWYTPDMQNKFPKCKADIQYCDAIANHFNEIEF